MSDTSIAEDQEKLRHLVDEIDDILLKLVVSTKVSPLTLSAIVLARLALLNKSCQSLDDFKRILESSMQSLASESDTQSIVLH
jgi:hypothetical protein